MVSARKLLLSLFSVALTASAAPTTISLYDNLNAQVSTYYVLAFNGPLYNSFSTGSSAVLLTDVKLMLEEINAFNSGTLTVALYANSGNAPGTQLQVLGTLTDATVSIPDGPSPYDFPVSPGVQLAANTRYWIGLTTANNSQSGWVVTNSLTGTGNISSEFSCTRQQQVTSAQTRGIKANIQVALTCGQNNGAGGFPPFLMTVNASSAATPPPATVPTLSAWGLLGLTALLVASAALFANRSARVLG